MLDIAELALLWGELWEVSRSSPEVLLRMVGGA